MKAMGIHMDSPNNKLGFTSGAIGGISDYIAHISWDMNYWDGLFHAAITAAVCGFLGIAGKELYILAKKGFKEYFGKRKKKDAEKD